MKLVLTLPLVELLVRVLPVRPGIEQVYNKIFSAFEMKYMYTQTHGHDIRAGCVTDEASNTEAVYIFPHSHM